MCKKDTKIVFVFEKHKNAEIKWKNYWQIFKDDGYKIIRIKDQNKTNWKKIKKKLKKANNVSIAGFAKAEYAMFIGLMSSKKVTTVFYYTQNTSIKKMVFNNDKFNINKINENIFNQKKIIILQNKKSFNKNNYNSKEIIDISTEKEHPNSIEYICEIRKIADEIVKNHKNTKIEFSFIGKTIFAFVFSQMFSYDSHILICNKKIINNIGK